MIHCYSPSQTATYLDCPLAWYLNRVERWGKQGGLGKKEMSAVIGTAVHAGVADYHTFGGDSIEIALDTLAGDVKGKEVFDTGQELYDKREKIVTAMIKRYREQETISELFRVEQIERRLGDQYGGSVPDMELEWRDGYMVVDLKTWKASSAYFKAKNIREFPKSRQMCHYAWALRDMGLPITHVGLSLLPRGARTTWEFHEFEIDWHYIDNVWLPSSLQIWSDMAACYAGTRTAYGIDNTDHKTKWGPCEFQKYCLGRAPQNDDRLIELGFTKRGK